MVECCERCVEITSVDVVSGSTTTFTINPPVNLFNGWCVTIQLGVCLPIDSTTTAENMQGNELVSITDGANTYPLMHRGQQVLSGQLFWDAPCGRPVRYRIGFAAASGTIPANFTLFNCLPKYAKFRLIGEAPA